MMTSDRGHHSVEAESKRPRLNSWSADPSHAVIQGQPIQPNAPDYIFPGPSAIAPASSASSTSTPANSTSTLHPPSLSKTSQHSSSISSGNTPHAAGKDNSNKAGPTSIRSELHAQPGFPAHTVIAPTLQPPQITSSTFGPASNNRTSPTQVQMSASTPATGPNAPQSSLHSNPMQQLRPLSLPAHSVIPPHPQQYPHIPQQQHDSHMSPYYSQNGGSTPVSANPGVVISGNTYSPGGSTPIGAYPPHHQLPQQAQTHPATPTAAVGGAVHYPGLPGVPSNEYGIGVGMPGGQGGVTTYPPFKRKAIRAAQACDACRARKAKCDEGRPSCGFCKETGIPCVYREVPPPKQDRTLLEILTRLGRIESLLDSQNSSSNTGINPTLSSTYSNRGSIHQSDQGMATLASAATSVAPLVSAGGGTQAASQSQTSAANVAATHVSPSATYPAVGPLSNPTEQILEGDEELTIPYQHTTAAHKLLWWPSIRSLIDGVYAENEGYIMKAEEGRGSLRIWGRGENAGSGDPFDEIEDLEAAWGVGWDSNEGGWIDTAGPCFDPTSEAVFDDVEDRALPKSGVRCGAGGLTSAGTLNLDPDTVREYLNSYLSNIHILHPVLDKGTISRTTTEFLSRITPPLHGSPTTSFSATDPSSSPTHAGLSRKSSVPNVTGKRKRSISVSGGSVQTGVANPPPPGQPRMHPRSSSTSGPVPSRPQLKQKIPRTIHSALVLLVMALGCVCLHRKPVPGPLPIIPTSPSKNAYSPPYNQPSGTGSTPPFTSTSTPPGYHPHNAYLANQSQQAPYRLPAKLARNIDIIPGLAYYAKAIEILGALFGGNELENVQAGILAGLYWGQLGRVLDSWKWISAACMGCQVLIRMKLSQEQEKDEVRIDLIKRVFWSCMQLESDVLAELDLPPSGISRLEDSVPLPNGLCTKYPDVGVQEDDPLIWLYYLAQIALRKLLNRAHTALYKQQIHRTASDTSRRLAIARELDFQLESWKSALPPPLRWDEMDEPSSDINAARLRAKYFGARYIIHRPFVYQVMHGLMVGGFSNVSPALSVSEVSGSPREATPAARRINGADDGSNKVSGQSLEASCIKCLEAAVSSTTAFHAFSASRNRPIITNVFGTAHAQFGNLLVLSAAYRCPDLKHIVQPQRLADLFSKTMFFLKTLSPISAALKKDLEILERIASKLDLRVDEKMTW